MIYFTQIFR